MQLGGLIRAERERRKLSQAEVANAVGLSRQAVAALEQGRGRVSTLVAIEGFMRLHVTGLQRAGSIIDEVTATRAHRGWSLRDAGHYAAISVNTVRNLETGTGSVPALIKLLAALSSNGRASVRDPKVKSRGLITVASRRDPNRDPNDYYATPPAIVRLLLDHEEFSREHPILEPAVGQARTIDKVLRERGFETTCFDVNGYGAEQRCFFDISERHHTIVTNPPFKLHLEFVRHAKQVATHKIALLMPLNYATGFQRHSELWNDTEFPLSRVHVLTRGIDFQRSDPTSDRFKASQMYMAWYVFEMAHVGPPHLNWIDNHAWVSRSSDTGNKLNNAAG